MSNDITTLNLEKKHIRIIILFTFIFSFIGKIIIEILFGNFGITNSLGELIGYSIGMTIFLGIIYIFFYKLLNFITKKKYQSKIFYITLFLSLIVTYTFLYSVMNLKIYKGQQTIFQDNNKVNFNLTKYHIFTYDKSDYLRLNLSNYNNKYVVKNPTLGYKTKNDNTFIIDKDYLGIKAQKYFSQTSDNKLLKTLSEIIKEDGITITDTYIQNINNIKFFIIEGFVIEDNKKIYYQMATTFNKDEGLNIYSYGEDKEKLLIDFNNFLNAINKKDFSL